MTATTFNLASCWRLEGRIEDVYEILSQPLDFVRWWPAVYLRVDEIEPGDDDGVGRVLKLHTRGWLPYTLDWQARATQLDKPNRIVIEADGDLCGRGEWRFGQDGDWVDVEYHWTVVAAKPWMRWLAPLLRPVFAANHRWAMRQGRQGLERELARRRFARD